MKTKTSQTKTSICRSSLYRETVARLLIALVLPFAWFAVSPQARAVCQNGCDDNLNAFLGEDALLNNTTGEANVAIGEEALFNNTTGRSNIAVGGVALLNNRTGVGNVATGGNALEFSTTADANTATGFFALWLNTTGFENTATGEAALALNTTGNDNTACGVDALGNNSAGSNNIALGYRAGYFTGGDNNIDIGNEGFGGVGNESGVIRIGTEGTHTATYIAGIRETPLVHGAAVSVGITSDGQLGVRTSSARFKEAVKPMDKASEAIFSLQPVTFRYKKDPAAVPQFGLVAEEVAKVNPDLVARDKEGKPFTVRYDEINAMLLNEFLKAHGKVQEQEATIAQLKSAVAKQEANAAQQQKQIEALTAGLQKVSAQLELSKAAPETVSNN
jgi:uncharacterized coiled-coil protein SlyX